MVTTLFAIEDVSLDFMERVSRVSVRVRWKAVTLGFPPWESLFRLEEFVGT